jgi:hypothetical protein
MQHLNSSYKWRKVLKESVVAYTALVRPILEYGAVCWDPYIGQIGALNRVQRRTTKFANNADQTGWESLAEHRMVSRLCALFKAYTERQAWEAIGQALKAMLPE